MNPYLLDEADVALTMFEGPAGTSDADVASYLSTTQPVEASAVETWALRMAKVCRTLDGELRGLKGWREEIDARIATRERRIKSIRDFVGAVMDLAQIKRAKDGQITIWRQDASRPSVVVDDLSAVPPAYRVVTFSGRESDIPEDVLLFLLGVAAAPTDEDSEKTLYASLDASRKAIGDALLTDGEIVPGVHIERTRFTSWR